MTEKLTWTPEESFEEFTTRAGKLNDVNLETIESTPPFFPGETVAEYRARVDGQLFGWIREQSKTKPKQTGVKSVSTVEGPGKSSGADPEDLDRIEARADAAIRRFRGKSSGLHQNVPGKNQPVKIYSDDEHDKRLQPVVEELRQTTEAVMNDFADLREDARRRLRALDYSDPSAGLSSQERERLAGSAPLIAGELAKMPVAPLADRLRAVVAGDDRAAKAAHLAAGAARLADEASAEDQEARAGFRKAAETGGASRRAPGDSAWVRVRESLGELERQLNPGVEEKRHKLREEIEAAGGAEFRIRNRLEEVSGAAGEAEQEARSYLRLNA